MRVFVTGGTGTIGSAVVAELLGNGHTVLALARSDSSERTLKDAGAEVLRGGLANLDVLRAGAAQSDGVVSLAFSPDYHSPEGLAAAIAEESAAMAALGEELIASHRPVVTVSGTPWVAGRASTEDDPLPLQGPVAGRARSVNARRSRPVPAGPRIGTGRNGLARRRRRGRHGARHRNGHRPATEPARGTRTAGELRPVRPDLRDGPARLQRPHPRRPRVAADAPQPPRGPGEHPALTRSTCPPVTSGPSGARGRRSSGRW
jgi:uncharacterized protein YbjT (DUF2867 family)